MLLEYCPNGSLVDLLYKKKKSGGSEYEKRAPLDEPRVLHVFEQVAAGVAHMHAQAPAISHRDLKLENVLCTADGSYVLCDFGSAVDTVLPASRSRKQAAVEEERIAKYSTLHFRAPEMCDLWREQEVGPKADVWALGCILYCLAFGDHPFPADSPLQILNAAWTFPVNSGRSAELHDVIRRTLAPDPAQRPSALEVVRMVQALRKGEGLPSSHCNEAGASWTAAFEEALFETKFDHQAPNATQVQPAEGCARTVQGMGGPCAELSASTAPAAASLAHEGVAIEPFADVDVLQTSPQVMCHLAAGDTAPAAVVDAVDVDAVGGASKGLAAFSNKSRPEEALSASAAPAVSSTNNLCGSVSAGVSAGHADARVSGARMDPAPAHAAALASAATGATLPADASCTAGSEAGTEARMADGEDAVQISVGVAGAAGASDPCGASEGKHTPNEPLPAAEDGPRATCDDGEEDVFGEFTSSADTAPSTGEVFATPFPLGDHAGDFTTSTVISKLPLPAAAAGCGAEPADGLGTSAAPPIAIRLPPRPKLGHGATSGRARRLDAHRGILGGTAPATLMSLPVGATAVGSGEREVSAHDRAGVVNPCEAGSCGASGCPPDRLRSAPSADWRDELSRESDFGDFEGAPT
jgi:hypothetical protein